jgi:RNA polymerase sigma-70 factor, ECF subfamily
VDVETRSDRELLTAVDRGESDAVAALYRRHKPWLAARLLRRAPDVDLVDEVVNDTFLAVWRGAARYRGDGSVPGWIWGIALRRLIDRFRAQPPATLPLTDTAAGSLPSAEDEVLQGVEHTALGAALTGLPPPLRQVVQATVLDGLTSAEAGRLLGLPAGTVKTRLKRARVLLVQAANQPSMPGRYRAQRHPPVAPVQKPERPAGRPASRTCPPDTRPAPLRDRLTRRLRASKRCRHGHRGRHRLTAGMPTVTCPPLALRLRG